MGVSGGLGATALEAVKAFQTRASLLRGWGEAVGGGESARCGAVSLRFFGAA